MQGWTDAADKTGLQLIDAYYPKLCKHKTGYSFRATL